MVPRRSDRQDPACRTTLSESPYWPELDVDLAVRVIRHPEHVPLVSPLAPNRASSGTLRQQASLAGCAPQADVGCLESPSSGVVT